MTSWKLEELEIGLQVGIASENIEEKEN